jgi:hypothetical protein
MLGIGGRFSSSPGMVRVPDLSGKTAAQSSQILSSLKIPFSQLSFVETQNSALNGLLQSQSFAAGTLIDYGTVLIIRFFTFVAPPPPPPPQVVYLYTIQGFCLLGPVTTFTGSFCSGSTLVRTGFRSGVRTDTDYYSDGSTVQRTVSCSSPSDSFVPCGCPPSNCSAVVSSSNYIVNNPGCASGRAWYRRDFYPACCSPSFADSYGGCIPR